MSTLTDLLSQRSVTALAALALVLAAAPVSAQLGLGLSPMRLELRFPAPAVQSGSLILTNGSTEKARMRAEVLDFFLDSQETPQFAHSYQQESAFSCRTWLSVNPMEADLEPGATMTVRYTMRVPSDATARSYHCGAGFTTLPSQDQISGTGLKTAVRVVAAFYAIVGDAPVEGKLKEVKLERTMNKDVPGWRVVVVMDNSGLMHYRTMGDLAVIDAEGKVVEKHDFSNIPVLPKREQQLIVPLQAPLTGGSYTLRARVDIGMPEVQEATVQVFPAAAPPLPPAKRPANEAASPAAQAPAPGSGASSGKQPK
jgi:P pilus assembly chaperone PapD